MRGLFSLLLATSEREGFTNRFILSSNGHHALAFFFPGNGVGSRRTVLYGRHSNMQNLSQQVCKSIDCLRHIIKY